MDDVDDDVDINVGVDSKDEDTDDDDNDVEFEANEDENNFIVSRDDLFLRSAIYVDLIKLFAQLGGIEAISKRLQLTENESEMIPIEILKCYLTFFQNIRMLLTNRKAHFLLRDVFNNAITVLRTCPDAQLRLLTHEKLGEIVDCLHDVRCRVQWRLEQLDCYFSCF